MNVHPGAETFLAAFLPRDRRDDLLADLEEEYRLLEARHGVRAARRWRMAQVAASVGPMLSRSLRLRVLGPYKNLGQAGLDLEMTRPWIGRIFLAFAAAWFMSVYTTVPLDLVDWETRQLPVVGIQSMPMIIGMSDGTTHAVYSLENNPDTQLDWPQWDWIERAGVHRRSSFGDFIRRPQNRYVVLAMGPPISMLICALVWLSASETWRSRGRFLRSAGGSALI